MYFIYYIILLRPRCPLISWSWETLDVLVAGQPPQDQTQSVLFSGVNSSGPKVTMRPPAVNTHQHTCVVSPTPTGDYRARLVRSGSTISFGGGGGGIDQKGFSIG